MRNLSLLLLLIVLMAGTHRAEAQTQPPVIFFSDLDSGPNSGGENVNNFSGAYVTLYGNFFGASQGASTVTWNGQNCLRVVPTTGSYSGWGTPYLWYQKIVVQVGSGCAAGKGNFVVTVNGTASNGIPFTVRAGNIFCVSTSGNDSNTGKFPNQCWATIPKAKNSMAAGDTSYVENGVNQTGLDDFDSSLAIDQSGAAGNPIALVVYPGATSTIGSASSTLSYALRTPNIGGFHFWTIAGFAIRSSNIGLEISGDSSDFRVIAIDASCPTAIGFFQGACMDTALGTTNMTFLGNYDHDNAQVSSSSGSATKGFHNMYFTTDSNHVIAAWNLIDGDTGQNLCNGGRCNACRGIQFHSSPAGGGGPGDPTGNDQFDLHVHDNVIRNTHCDGINFATVDPSRGPVEAYNNVIYHVGTGVLTGDTSSYACIYFPGILNNGPAPTGTAEVYNNTCYDFGAPADGESGGLSILAAGFKVNFRNNIVYALSGQSYISSNGLADITPYMGSNNLFFGNGAAPGFLTANINSDPLFLDLKLTNFHLQSGSPAKDAGTTINGSNTFNNFLPFNGIPEDSTGTSRPQGTAFDVGAFEFFSGSDSRPAPPTNVTVVAH